MYSLKVKKDFTTEDGTLYMAGHDANQLTAFEAAYLLDKYPDNFEAANPLTADFAGNKENVKHLAAAHARLLGGE